MHRLAFVAAAVVITAGWSGCMPGHGNGGDGGSGGSDGSNSGSCGPNGAPADGIGISTGVETASFSGLSASANNDCNLPGSPAGVVSLTITGKQTGTNDQITFCIPRPDLFEDGQSHTVGNDHSTADLWIVDLEAENADCSYDIDATTGYAIEDGDITASASGMCKDGTDSAGFALTIEGAVNLDESCSGETDVKNSRITGTAAIAN
jgi:hypothetical protein